MCSRSIPIVLILLTSWIQSRIVGQMLFWEKVCLLSIFPVSVARHSASVGLSEHVYLVYRTGQWYTGSGNIVESSQRLRLADYQRAWNLLSHQTRGVLQLAVAASVVLQLSEASCPLPLRSVFAVSPMVKEYPC